MGLAKRTLKSLCIDVLLVYGKGSNFIKGLAFMYASNMIPDKLCIMMVNDSKFHLQFWIPHIDMHPFTVIFKDLQTVWGGIGHLSVWKVKRLEILNCVFDDQDTKLIGKAMRTLKPKVIVLMNCAYDGITEGEDTDCFYNAISNDKTIEIMEFGDERIYENDEVESSEDEIVDRHGDVYDMEGLEEVGV